MTTGSKAQPVASVEALVQAVGEAKSGAVIELAAGTFELSQPLDLKSGITLQGAGIGQTIRSLATRPPQARRSFTIIW